MCWMLRVLCPFYEALSLSSIGANNIGMHCAPAARPGMYPRVRCRVDFGTGPGATLVVGLSEAGKLWWGPHAVPTATAVTSFTVSRSFGLPPVRMTLTASDKRNELSNQLFRSWGRCHT